VRAARLALVGVAFVASACATAEAPRTVAPEPPRVVAPEPPRPPLRQPLAAPHLARAADLERDGFLRRALDEWKIARTIDPDSAPAREGQAKLTARIEGLVAERVNEGRAALARGSQTEARRRLLAALALDPGNRTIVTMLQNEARDVEFLTHTVRAGDTLASLAERYYGDRSRGEVIWETNQLPPNPRLTAGTTLKIPEIPASLSPVRGPPPCRPRRPARPWSPRHALIRPVRTRRPKSIR
jgi:nucleoid-associated protein YgaU